MKSKKITKIIGAGGLAFFMGVGTLCGVLIAPMGATSASNSGDPAALAQSPDRALKLNPQTDETIFTTETGIEIKSHNLSASGAESSIQYFTLGAYNGTPVNWLIVGTSNQMAENATDAGALINAAAGNGKLVTGATSSDLEPNQILCISEYAFNQSSLNVNAIANDDRIYNFSAPANATDIYLTTDQFADYCKSYDILIDVKAESLILGTRLGINGYYGSGRGKIVTNSTFSSNYVFSLSADFYKNYVGVTSYATPLCSNNVAVNLYLSDTSLQELRKNTFSIRQAGIHYYASGQGLAVLYLNNYITNTGIATTNYEIAEFVATPSDTGGTYGTKYVQFHHYKSAYSVTNNPISIAYRPAFVMQL